MRRDSSFPSFKFLQAQDFFVTQPRIYLREQNREDSNKVEDTAPRGPISSKQKSMADIEEARLNRTLFSRYFYHKFN